MPLFDLRDLSKKSDSAIAKKSKTLVKKPQTIHRGGDLYGKIREIVATVEKYLGDKKDNFCLITDPDELHQYIDCCVSNGYISIDTETDGLDPLRNQLAGICIYTYGQKGAYIPLNHVSYITNERVANQLPVDQVVQEFERLLECKPTIDMFNAKFDIRFLRAAGLRDIYCTWDGYLASRLLNENEPHKGLKPLHEKYCGHKEAFSFDTLFKGVPFPLIPLQTAVLYAANDPVITTELCDYQRQYLREDSEREDMRQIYWVFKNIEMPCVDVMANMEDNGILFDMGYQKELSIKYNQLLQEKLDDFYRELQEYDKEITAYRRKNPNNKLDTPINISSPAQLAIFFYDILGCDVIDSKSPRGTGEEILNKMDNPVAKAVLEYRTMSKLVDTYIDKLPNCVNPNDGRVHCSFNQYGADTGRMSSSDPNLQNIPSKNKDIRKMFIASPGYLLMSSDFSQQEPKCLAALCKKHGDPQMYDTFMQGKDLYSEIASKAFNEPYNECLEHFPAGTPIKKQGKKWYYATEDDYDKLADGENDTYADGKARRTQAKSILLGVLYGRGVASIAEQLGCSTDKAQTIKNSVFRGFPAIKQFEEDSLDMAYDIGYVTTVCGRKRRLPDLQLEEFEFRWEGGAGGDVLDFESDEEMEVPENLVRKYLAKLHSCKFWQKRQVFEQANKEGVWIVDNGKKIADASRQCVNSRIQGSAADLTKLAMIQLNNNERLKELGFRLLIPVHDEVIAECPEENIKECSELLAQIMSQAAEKILEMPIKCDVEVTRAWYGEKINIEEV